MEIYDLTERHKDRTNRQVRNTLTFKYIPKKDGERSWNDTRNDLTRMVANDMRRPKTVSNIFEHLREGFQLERQ